MAPGFVCLGSETSDWLRLKLFVEVGAGTRPTRAIGHPGQARSVIGGGSGPRPRAGPEGDRHHGGHAAAAGPSELPAPGECGRPRPHPAPARPLPGFSPGLGNSAVPHRPSPSPGTRRGQVTPTLRLTHRGQCGPGDGTRTGKAAGSPGFWFLAQPKAALQKNTAPENVPDKPSRTPGTSLARGKALSSGPVRARSTEGGVGLGSVRATQQLCVG